MRGCLPQCTVGRVWANLFCCVRSPSRLRVVRKTLRRTASVFWRTVNAAESIASRRRVGELSPQNPVMELTSLSETVEVLGREALSGERGVRSRLRMAAETFSPGVSVCGMDKLHQVIPLRNCRKNPQVTLSAICSVVFT